MGVKVKKVKDVDTFKEITVKDCENGYIGDYVCHIDGCNAGMSFTHSYEQQRMNMAVHVPSFFKLKAKNKHAFGICPYDTRSAVEIIARDSDTDLLKSIDNQKYEFRLLVLHRPESSSPIPDRSDQSKKSNTDTDSKTKKYRRKGTAPAYINVLDQILTLRSKLEGNEELTSLVKLSYQGRKIPWKRFYFDSDEYFEAYETVSAAKSPYPVCLQGYVSKVIPPTEKFKYPQIKLSSPFVKPSGPLTSLPRIELILNDPLIDLTEYPSGTEVLVYGKVSCKKKLWTPPEEKDQAEPKKLQFLNMSVWLNHSQQLMPIEE